MSAPEVEALLAGPAGRAVLAELVGLDLFRELGEPVPGGVRLVQDGTAPAGRRRGKEAPAGQRRGAPDARAGELIAAAVSAADLGELASCRDRLLLLSAVANVIEGRQAAAGPYLAAARNALGPVAEALVAAPAARWWWEPVNRSGQRWAGAEGTALPRGAALAAAVQRIAAAEAQEELDAARGQFWQLRRRHPISISWWSAPLGGTVFTTTGPIETLPAVELGCVEDSAGEEVREVWAVEIDPDARVREIGGPADWARLAAEFPRDVTASRQHDWDSWTGQESTWVLPDWPAVSREWDGVHVSVSGYLSASGFAIAAGNASTLLAGWEPDQALWLKDVFAKAEYVAPWRGSPGSDALPDVTPPWQRHRAGQPPA